MSRKWAVYDEYEECLQGGFNTQQEAHEWLGNHLPWDVILLNWRGDGSVMRVATEFEADLVLAQTPGPCNHKRRCTPEEFVITGDWR
jgi:hypothetical protein